MSSPVASSPRTLDFSHQKIATYLEYQFPKEIVAMICGYHVQEVWEKIEPIKLKGLGYVLHLITPCIKACSTINKMDLAISVASISHAALAIQEHYRPFLSETQFLDLFNTGKYEFIHFMLAQMKYNPPKAGFRILYRAIKKLKEPQLGKALEIYLKFAPSLCHHAIEEIRSISHHDQASLKILNQLKGHNNCECIFGNNARQSYCQCQSCDYNDLGSRCAIESPFYMHSNIDYGITRAL